MIKTYKDLKNYHFKDDGEIPKVIYRTGKYSVNDLPKEILELYNNEILNNPEYTFFYFDDKDCEEFIILEYGITMFDWYSQLIPTAFRADFWRYLILYKHGGVYIDFSMETLIPIKDIIKSYKEIYVRDTCDLCGVYNAFICTVKETGILKNVIDLCIDRIRRKYKGVGALDTTGPTVLGRVVKDLFNKTFYEWINLGEYNENLYIYSNPSNLYIEDETGAKIVKNKMDKHYSLTYDVYIDSKFEEMLPLNHYSRLWADDKVFK